MTTVALTTVWLNLATDLSDYQSFSYMSGLNVNTMRPGTDREYANGRLRLVLNGSTRRTFQLTLPACTRDQIDWLELHTAELMLVRDDRGRKVWGTYFKMSVSEKSADTDSGDVEIEFKQITHSEAV